MMTTLDEVRNFGVIESKPLKQNQKKSRTNEEIFVPAHKNTFKPGKLLKKHLKSRLVNE